MGSLFDTIAVVPAFGVMIARWRILHKPIKASIKMQRNMFWLAWRCIITFVKLTLLLTAPLVSSIQKTRAGILDMVNGTPGFDVTYIMVVCKRVNFI